MYVRLSVYYLIPLSSSEDQTSKVKHYLMEILTTILQEGESFSQEVLDAILGNIIEPAKVLTSYM